VRARRALVHARRGHPPSLLRLREEGKDLRGRGERGREDVRDGGEVCCWVVMDLVFARGLGGGGWGGEQVCYGFVVLGVV